MNRNGNLATLTGEERERKRGGAESVCVGPEPPGGLSL